MTGDKDRLYERLPAIYRIRDAQQGYTLRALLRVIEEQANILEDDISRMYENWFIETCDDWVIPYIGDLLGYLPLHNTGEPIKKGSARDSDRNRILIPGGRAKTIRYRRRKGTLALLELLSNDIADWPARAVEFYRLLGWTQALNHMHMQRGQTTEIRNVDRLERLDGPFDSLAHTIDLRRISSGLTTGRYNIPNIGVFACRLQSYPVTKTTAFHVDAAGAKNKSSPSNYTFSVLGNDTPLFTLAEREDDPKNIAQEINLPVQIGRTALEMKEKESTGTKYSQVSEVYYGKGKSLAIWAPGWKGLEANAEEASPDLVLAHQVIVADLSAWKYNVPKNRIAVDPVLGRIKFPAAQKKPANVFVHYHYGFSADIGGGEYSRPIPNPDPKAISKFLPSHFKDIDGFVAHIAAVESYFDPVSAYVKDKLSDDTKKELGGGTSSSISELIVRDLNVLLADEALYDDRRFENVEFTSSELKGLLGKKLEGDLIIRRNRLLLESLYPSFISASLSQYRVGELEQYKKINDALEKWAKDGPMNAVIEITDGGVYVEPISIRLGPGQSLYLRAAAGKRPVIRQLNWMTSAPDSVMISGGAGSRVVMDGLLITGRGVRISGPDISEEETQNSEDLCEVVLRHCTLVPGWTIGSDLSPEHGNEASIELINTRSQVRIEKSIVGSIMVSAYDLRSEPNRIHMKDSILDATDSDFDAISAPDGLIAHATLSFERCTVLGKVTVHGIKLAQDSIFTGKVMVARTQAGCMRFCYLPADSRTPRKFHCQTDTSINLTGPNSDNGEDIEAPARPSFTSTKYGMPAYCQLSAGCPVGIREGAEDKSELGVFHDLYQPQREANLRLRLSEYTPTGMESDIIFIN